MDAEPYDLNNSDKWKMPAEKVEVDPEVEAAYYDAKPPPRCHTCWNLEQWCTCLGRRADITHSEHPSVAGIHHEARERLLSAYAQRGVAEIERIINGSE